MYLLHNKVTRLCDATNVNYLSPEGIQREFGRNKRTDVFMRWLNLEDYDLSSLDPTETILD